MKKSKFSLITSLLTLLLCVAMFVGTTFAWFTDSVVNTGNKIQAGTLQVDLLQKGNTLSEEQKDVLKNRKGYEYHASQFYSLKKQSNDDTIDTVPVFNYVNWQPGDSDYKVFRVTNNGSLDLDYRLCITLKDNRDLNTLKDLADLIIVKVVESKSLINANSENQVFNNAEDKKLSELLFDKDGNLIDAVILKGTIAAAGSTTEDTEHTTPVVGKSNFTNLYVQIALSTEAGNYYQGKSFIDTFDIKLEAKQTNFDASWK